MKKLIFIYILFISIFGANAFGAPVSVKARLDSAYLLQGKLGTLHLEVVTPSNVSGSFPILTPNERGYISVCSDSIELRTSITVDTTDLGSGKRQINYHIPIQGFDSGFYKLPELIYIAGKDSAKSNSVRLKIVPVNVTANDSISPYADVVGPYNPSIADKLPDALVEYWWLWLLILAVLAGGGYFYYKLRSKGENIFKKEKPQPSPYEIAVRSLEALKNQKLWENGQDRQYFTRLTEILREYLDGRFGINAMEMTSRQILEKLTEYPETKGKRDYVREVLSMADFVKFAKMRPLPDDNIDAYTNALKFIEYTKPTEINDENINSGNTNKDEFQRKEGEK